VELTRDSFDQYAGEVLIISPNIGIPVILDKDARIAGSDEAYTFCMNVVGPAGLPAPDCQEKLEGHVHAVPLFEIESGTMRLRRGTPLAMTLLSCEPVLAPVLDSISIADLYEFRKERPSYLLRHDFFGTDRALFLVKANINLQEAEECQTWLVSHPYLMFDLVQDFQERDPAFQRVCYHALVIRRKSWQTLNIAHATDMHVARRYDEILGVLSKELDITQGKPYMSGLGIKKKMQAELHEEYEYDKFDPLIRRFQNPNNKLRQFIIWANNAAAHEKLDLVLITGDNIDYCLKEHGHEHGEKGELYELHETNWDVFLRILLNQPIEYRPDCTPKNIVFHEEIAVPIFTLTGNHDVRVNGYPLTATKFYQYFGMTKLEAKLYSDPVKTSEIKALHIDKYCLRPYYQYINPFDDYFLKFGDQLFIFLNSGSDALLSVKSLIMSNPASVGFKNTQIKFAKNVISKIALPINGRMFFVSHGPILNPAFKRALLQNKLGRLLPQKWITPNFYKESSLARFGISNHDVSKKLNFTYGTITKNWGRALKLLHDHRMIALHGHTHLFREFHFSSCDHTKDCELEDLEEIKKKNPFAIYWDDYSIFKDAKFFDDDRPFDLQTPSLGIRRLEEEKKFGAFRKISLQGNQLAEIDVHYVSDLDEDL